MGVGDENQRILQFVLEDGRTFRTWKKHTEIIESFDLTEQVFGANYAGSRLANEINEWRPITGKINDTIKQACIEHVHGGRWNASNYNISDVICIDIKECYPASIRGQGECIPWFNRFGHCHGCTFILSTYGSFKEFIVLPVRYKTFSLVITLLLEGTS
ncbi:hypothetical protein Glove_645g59 [Diversispora epigaea]|uniref:Uncharacterized protein n=1 Tax=Diversispora epigaea TaxID=1348612 RepID=A0A397G4C9_9GLOM|nr:hypothetical protein Glove_645g59 [Diversispora epigaea]